MNNYKIKIQYDGTNYSGWQVQPNTISVQQKIGEALKIILREDVKIIGSGRTDKGVHALGQVANFKIKTDIDFYRIEHAINSILPSDISISDFEKVAIDFNSRFDAKKRSYIYLISNLKSPFMHKYSWKYKNFNQLNLEQLNIISEVLKGEHDFTSFSKKNTVQQNKVCKIHNIRWYKKNGMVFFLIEGNRFLHGMVRTILGTVIEAFNKGFPGDYLLEVLSKKDRSEAGKSVPAKGLFLFKVKY